MRILSSGTTKSPVEEPTPSKALLLKENGAVVAPLLSATLGRKSNESRNS